jgi:hypothetical protein
MGESAPADGQIHLRHRPIPDRCDYLAQKLAPYVEPGTMSRAALVVVAATIMHLDNIGREVRALLDERDAANTRAVQAETALAQLQERLGKTDEEWGVSWNEMVGTGPLDYDDEAAARTSAENLRDSGSYHGVTGVRVKHRWAGEWRDADDGGGGDG